MYRHISLDGTWDYTPLARVVLKPGGEMERDTRDLPPAGQMAIPNHWEQAGLTNFHGSVQFTRTFEFDGLREDEASLWLTFKAVDYFAKVWLNDTFLGEHTGYFQPFSFDITGTVRTGTNALRVEVICPLEEPGTVWPDQKIVIKGILNHWDCRPGSWDLETGQDHNSGGIWNSVALETRPVAYLDYVRVTTRLVPVEAPASHDHRRQVALGPDTPRKAIVFVDSDVIAPAGEYMLEVQIGDEPAVTQPVAMQNPLQRCTAVLQLMQPKLWWTWDLGEPHMEQCTVRLIKDGKTVHEKQFEVGLREIEFNPDNGEWTLNGRRFFVRGTNVVPTLWLGEYNAEMIATDIRMLREAHINGVRVCVHINREEFYTACDHAGILIWQDFALQWSYDETVDLMTEAVRQIKDMVRLLVNHPSIGLWCCQNESSFYNKYILDPVLADAVAAEDTSRFIRSTSEYAEHTYGGWYTDTYHLYNTLPATPVLTEFGAQALPEVESARKMGGDRWPPDWKKMAFHDFQYDMTFNVAKIQTGDNWNTFVQNSQAYQAKLLKYAIERYRQAKYKKLGCMFQFMFMDCWPSITWSVVSYDRIPKQGYFTLQECFQPVLIGFNPRRDTMITGVDRGGHARPLWVSPWIVNDRHEALEGCTYSVILSGPGGEFEYTQDQPVTVPADSVCESLPPVRIDLAPSLPPGDYTVTLQLCRNGATVSCNSYPLMLAANPV